MRFLYETKLIWETRPVVGLVGADLSGIDLSGADLPSADLHGTDLSGADLRGTDLGEADLSLADLHQADLSQWTVLNQADLHRAKLSEATLRGADLSRANLLGADLRGGDLRRANLSEAGLTAANLEGADLRQTSLLDTNLTYVRSFQEAIIPANRQDGDIEEEAAREAAVEEAILDHYAALRAGRFRKAYSYFSSTFQSENDEQEWIAQEESGKVTGSSINSLEVEEVSDSAATANVDISFKDETGQPRFGLTWELVKEGGEWKLDSASD